MVITMLDPVEVIAKEFDQSHLWNKLQKVLVVSRIFESVAETSSSVKVAASFDLDDPEIYDIVRQDYEIVRDAIRTRRYKALSGYLGTLVQPRTKGFGHESTSRAFYARTQFVSYILGLTDRSFIAKGISDPR